MRSSKWIRHSREIKSLFRNIFTCTEIVSCHWNEFCCGNRRWYRNGIDLWRYSENIDWQVTHKCIIQRVEQTLLDRSYLTICKDCYDSRSVCCKRIKTNNKVEHQIIVKNLFSWHDVGRSTVCHILYDDMASYHILGVRRLMPRDFTLRIAYFR